MTSAQLSYSKKVHESLLVFAVSTEECYENGNSR